MIDKNFSNCLEKVKELKEKFKFSPQYLCTLPQELIQQHGDPRQFECTPDGYVMLFFNPQDGDFRLVLLDEQFKQQQVVYRHKSLSGFFLHAAAGKVYVILADYAQLRSDAQLKTLSGRIVAVTLGEQKEEDLPLGNCPVFPSTACLLPDERFAYFDYASARLVLADLPGKAGASSEPQYIPMGTRFLQNLNCSSDQLFFESMPRKNSFYINTNEPFKTIYRVALNDAALNGAVSVPEPVFAAEAGINLYSYALYREHVYAATSVDFKKTTLLGQTVYSVSTHHHSWLTADCNDIPVLFNLRNQGDRRLLGLARFMTDKKYGMYRICAD